MGGAGGGATTTTSTTTTSTTSSSSGGGGEGGGVEAVCGNGAVEAGEACDDGATEAGDGCSALCALELGYVCAGEPSQCATDCGDGVLAGAEACDDGNRVADDGCSLTCTVELGFACVGVPSQCASTCGDNQIAADEGCDDGNTTDGDGCSAGCDIDAGWACAGAPSVCSTSCGDGIVAGMEGCDDGNNANGDGCSAACALETGFACTGAPSVCASTCGDGVRASDEQCDDANTTGGDCCSSSCVREAACEIEPNNTIATANDYAALQAGGLMYGFVNPAGDVNYYMVTLAAPGSIEVLTSAGVLGTPCATSATTPPGVDTRVRVFDATSATPIAENDDANGNWCSALTVNVPPGTYYIAVDASPLAPTNGQTTFDYTIEITTQTFVCGNGSIEPGEQCDDGDAMGGDGCSATCQIEPGYICVNQPSVCTLGGQGATCTNPFVATNGSAITGADIAQFGDSYTFGDPSCAASGMASSRPDIVFQIDLVAGQYLRVTEHGTLDVLLHVLGTTCGATSCAASFDGLNDTEASTGVLYQAMSTGTHYVAVESFFATPLPTQTFDVRFEVITPLCGDGTLAPGEQCDDGNSTPGDGCSAGCQVELGYTCSGAPSACTSVLPGCTGTVIIAQASGLPAAIPDNQPNGGAALPINVAQAGTITNMAMGFGATHTYTSDLDIYLTGPNAVQRNVCLDRGGAGDDFISTVFRDDGTSLATAVAPFTGVFAPEQLFSYFDGQSVTGTWTVRVADDLGSDVGSVTELYLAFCVTP